MTWNAAERFRAAVVKGGVRQTDGFAPGTRVSAGLLESEPTIIDWDEDYV